MEGDWGSGGGGGGGGAAHSVFSCSGRAGMLTRGDDAVSQDGCESVPNGLLS